ncbi:MAG: hypothetical protein D6732_24810 [Methanobacteriota archaeon]|nr:MAG: hypothetical protein D6732_24810 [Euryarchaeota archaeon]
MDKNSSLNAVLPEIPHFIGWMLLFAILLGVAITAYRFWQSSRLASARAFADEIISHLARFFESHCNVQRSDVEKYVRDGTWPADLKELIRSITLIFDSPQHGKVAVSLEVTATTTDVWSSQWYIPWERLPESIRSSFIMDEHRIIRELTWPITINELINF